MKITIVEFLLGIIETYLIIYAGLSLFGVFKKKSFYLKISLLNMLMIFIVRNFFPFFGVHTFLSIIIIVFSINRLTDKNWKFSIISTLLGYILLLIGETTATLIAYNLPNFDLKAAIEHKTLNYHLVVIASKFPLIISSILARYDFVQFSDFSFEQLSIMEDDFNDEL